MELLTYRQLLKALMELPDHALDTSVTFVDVNAGESYPVRETMLVSELDPDVLENFDGVLEMDQFVLSS